MLPVRSWYALITALHLGNEAGYQIFILKVIADHTALGWTEHTK